MSQYRDFLNAAVEQYHKTVVPQASLQELALLAIAQRLSSLEGQLEELNRTLDQIYPKDDYGNRSGWAPSTRTDPC